MISEARQSPTGSGGDWKIISEILNMNLKSIKRHLSFPRFGNSAHVPVTEQPRRLSIQETFTKLTKSFSSFRLTPSKSSGEGWDLFGVMIDKDILENIRRNHYKDPSIKV